MEITNIYVLIDPITNIVRYVGKANNVTQRYRAHLNRARKHQIHKKNWIEQLKREGLKPIIEVIDIVPINDWIFWETYWISQMRTWGFDLINYTNGGDGCTFGNQTSFKKGQGGKKVIGYNSLFEKVYEFDTAEDATKHFNTHRSSIPKCASGKTKTIKKIAWFYFEDIVNLSVSDVNEKIKNRFTIIKQVNSGSFKKGNVSLKKQKVEMYSLEGEYLKTFESIGDAAKEVCVTNGSIQFACTKSKKGVCKNYKWKYSK
jgi:hypothetical protein